jgi:hypothetical protein
MRKLILVALLAATPFFALGSSPAAACGWKGGYASDTVNYAPRRAYRRAYRGAYYGGAMYRPRVGVVGARAWRGGRRWR